MEVSSETSDFYFIRYGDIAVQSACTVSLSTRASELDKQCMHGRRVPKIIWTFFASTMCVSLAWLVSFER